jgi:hypothetical protein
MAFYFKTSQKVKVYFKFVRSISSKIIWFKPYIWYIGLSDLIHIEWFDSFCLEINVTVIFMMWRIVV